MKALKILLLFSLVFIVGCQPSEQAIQTALAQTQAAIPTATQTKILPTNTPLPTDTPIPTVTTTILPTSTPDLGVIDVDPRKLLLKKEYLPSSGKYFLPGPGWISPSTNAEVISSRTVEEGQTYIAETGRVHGWFVDYKRGTNGAVLPEEIYNNAILFSTAKGAQALINKYDPNVNDDEYKEIEAPQIGDVTRVYKKTQTDAGGQSRVWLELQFTYRNVFYQIGLYGWDREISIDLASEIADKLLSDLTQLPVSDTVTFQP